MSLLTFCTKCYELGLQRRQTLGQYLCQRYMLSLHAQASLSHFRHWLVKEGWLTFVPILHTGNWAQAFPMTHNRQGAKVGFISHLLVPEISFKKNPSFQKVLKISIWHKMDTGKRTLIICYPPSTIINSWMISFHLYSIFQLVVAKPNLCLSLKMKRTSFSVGFAYYFWLSVSWPTIWCFSNFSHWQSSASKF